MTSNQLTPEQRAATRMLGRPVFAAGHGYGMGVAVVMEPEEPTRYSVAGARNDRVAGCVRQVVAGRSERRVGSDIPRTQHGGTASDGGGIGLGVWSAIAAFHDVATA